MQCSQVVPALQLSLSDSEKLLKATCGMPYDVRAQWKKIKKLFNHGPDIDAAAVAYLIIAHVI